MESAETAVSSASARAYLALERAIVMLELPPDSLTTERTLIERLRLGRTPVREAIQRLAWEGLVVVKPRAGLAIAPLDSTDWLKVVDVRAGVELLLARSATRLIDAEGEARFQRVAETMRKTAATNDIAGFLDADKAFDETLALVADNPFAARVAAPLQTHSRRFWFRHQREVGLMDMANLHLAIIGKIVARDEEGAQEQTRRLMSFLRTGAITAENS